MVRREQAPLAGHAPELAGATVAERDAQAQVHADGVPGSSAREPCTSSVSLHRAMHIGLNLIFLVPGETGGMEVYARELIPALVAV